MHGHKQAAPLPPVLFLYTLTGRGVGEPAQVVKWWENIIVGYKRALVIKELCTYPCRSVLVELASCCSCFIRLKLECAHLGLWPGSSLTCVEAFSILAPFPDCKSVLVSCYCVKVRSSTIGFQQILWKRHNVWDVLSWKIKIRMKWKMCLAYVKLNGKKGRQCSGMKY